MTYCWGGGGGVTLRWITIPFRGEHGNIRSCHGNWDNVLLGSDAESTSYLLLIMLCKIAEGWERAPHHKLIVKQEINNVGTMQDIFPDNELIAYVTKRLVAL